MVLGPEPRGTNPKGTKDNSLKRRVPGSLKQMEGVGVVGSGLGFRVYGGLGFRGGFRV